jgi:hypothetical protein
MAETLKPYTTLTDFLTGRQIPNVGAEENRQAVARFLVEQRGYEREDIEAGVALSLSIGGEVYRSQLDLVVSVDGRRAMVVTCAAGALGSWERQTLAAARLLEGYQIPYSVVSDGKTAAVLDTVSAERIGSALEAIPSKTDARQALSSTLRQPLAEERRLRESLIFRTYDMETVNTLRRP